MLYDWLDGVTPERYGPVPAHVNLSARQAKNQGLMTSGTYGQAGFGLSLNAARERSLENRLQALCPGSTLFAQTWKRKTTPHGRSLLAHTASAPRTSANDCTSWPTATVNDSRNGRNLTANRNCSIRGKVPHSGVTLCDAAGWPTPTVGTGGGDQRNPQKALERMQSGRRNLDDAAAMHGWATPAAQEAGGTAEQFLDRKRANGTCGVSLTALSLQAQTASAGQLNPALSRWLMGYPEEWDSCGATAMQSCRKSRQRS